MGRWNDGDEEEVYIEGGAEEQRMEKGGRVDVDGLVLEPPHPDGFGRENRTVIKIDNIMISFFSIFFLKGNKNNCRRNN